MRARRALRAVVFVIVSMASAAEAAEPWVEARSAHFRVVSNAGDGRARQTLWEFEQIRAAYARMWAWVGEADARPTVVLALKDEPTMKQWAPTYYEVKGGIDLVSLSVHGADRDYLLLVANSRPADQDVAAGFNLYRMYLGSILSNAFERRLPVWLSDGITEVFANIVVRDKDILAGRPVPWHIRQFTGQPRPALGAVLEAKADSPLLLREDQRNGFDAYCWTLVHYLFFADRGAHQAKVGRFTELWAAGKSQEQALAEAFGDMSAIEAQLPAYARREILTYAQFPAAVAIEREKLPVRAIPPAEVAGLLAAVHVGMNRQADAEKAIQSARTADPKGPGSYDAEGLLADRAAARERAVAAYARAAELGSTNAHTYYRAAQLAWKSEADTATLAAMRQRLEKAIELHPNHAGAHSFLAETMVQQGQSPAALPLAERAVKLEPAESYHYLAIARVYHGLSRAVEARAAATRAAALASNDNERRNATTFLDYLARSAAHEQRRAASEAWGAKVSDCLTTSVAACVAALPGAEKACTDGQSAGCSLSAWIYREGRGVTKDEARALALDERACTAGEKQSCVQHAWSVARGEGVAANEARGMAALDGLCTDNVLEACTRLAALHLGKATPKSKAHAKELLTRACQGGAQDACALLKRVQ